MKADHGYEVGARSGELQDHRTTEAIADRCDRGGIGPRLADEHLQPAIRPWVGVEGAAAVKARIGRGRACFLRYRETTRRVRRAPCSDSCRRSRQCY
jgi:hypothetical protein